MTQGDVRPGGLPGPAEALPRIRKRATPCASVTADAVRAEQSKAIPGNDCMAATWTSAPAQFAKWRATVHNCFGLLDAVRTVTSSSQRESATPLLDPAS